MTKKVDKDWKALKEASETEEEMESPQEEAIFGEDMPADLALEHPDYEALEEKLTEAEQKAHDNWEKAVRAQAELDNVRKRAEREIENAHRFGLEKIIKSLIPVLDSLEQAMQLAEQHDNKGMLEGLDLTLKLFLEVLEKSDVEQLNPEGAPFDPQMHEAMSIQQTDEVPENTVISVFQKGYVLSNRVIRPARVIVAKK